MDKSAEKSLIKTFVTEDYITWLKSMQKYAPAIPLGILAQMQPSKNGIERDYPLNPMCSFFNAQIMLQKELMGKEFYRAFLLVYFSKAATWYYRSVDEKIVNVKTHASELGLSDRYVYDMAHKFVLTSYNNSCLTMASNEKLEQMKNPNFKF